MKRKCYFYLSWNICWVWQDWDTLRHLPRLSGDIQRQARDCFLPDLSVSCSIIVSDGQNQARPDPVKINLSKEKLQETMLTSTLILWVALFRDIELNRKDNTSIVDKCKTCWCLFSAKIEIWWENPVVTFAVCLVVYQYQQTSD